VLAGNQECADQIAASLRANLGDTHDYKVSVKYLDGTVWLQGHVRDRAQMQQMVAVIVGTPGVSVKQIVRDELKIGNTASQGKRSGTAGKQPNPLRGVDQMAQAVPSSYTAKGAVPVAMMQPVPVPAPNGRPAPLPVPQDVQAGPTGIPGAPLPMYPQAAGGPAPMRTNQAAMPNYAWPSYAAYPNYAGVTYPKQYSPTAWPYIGPFYPYPQVPLGWRKVSLEWDDGWWFLDFKDGPRCAWWR
jgi:hypothetical protein